MAVVEKVKVVLDAEVSKFRKQMSGAAESVSTALRDVETRAGLAEGSLGRLGRAGGVALAGLAASAGAATLAMIKQGSEIAKLSRSVGASAQGYQKLDLALSRIGDGTIEVRDLFIDLNEKLGEAAEYGTGEGFEALNQLGIKMEELAGLTVDQKFIKITDALASLNDEQRAAALAAQIFGGRGNELIELFEKGEGYLQRFGDEMEDTGRIMDESLIQSAEEANQKFTKLFDSLNGVGVTALAAYSDELDLVAEAFDDVITKSRDFLLSRALEDTTTLSGRDTALATEQRQLTRENEQLTNDRGAFRARITLTGDVKYPNAFGAENLDKRKEENAKRLVEIERERAEIQAQIAEQTQLEIEARAEAEEVAEETNKKRSDEAKVRLETAKTEKEAADTYNQSQEELLEKLRIRQELRIAELEENDELAEKLTRQLELMDTISTLRSLGIDEAKAQAEAEEYINELFEARAEAAQRIKDAKSEEDKEAKDKEAKDHEEALAKGVKDFVESGDISAVAEQLGLDMDSTLGQVVGGLGDLLSGVLGDALSGLFGGKDSLGGAIFGGILNGLVSGFGGGFGGGKSGGGLVMPGLAYQVGEAGPETIVPLTASRVVPNGGGQTNIVVNNNSSARISTQQRDNNGSTEHIIEVIEADFQRHGRAARSMQRNFSGVRRRAD